MANVTRKCQVKRKPEAVIDYLSDVENHPAFIPPLKSVGNIAGDPKRKGTHWDWTFVMAGVEINGSLRRRTTGRQALLVQDHRDRQHVHLQRGGRWQRESVTGGVVYEVPQGVLAKMADKTVVERLQR